MIISISQKPAKKTQNVKSSVMAVSNKYEVHTICVFFEICLGCFGVCSERNNWFLLDYRLCKRYVVGRIKKTEIDLQSMNYS